MKYIVESLDAGYLTPRRNNGVMYESRSSWSKDIDDAKIFQTKGAATNSANQAPPVKLFKVKIVRFYVVENALEIGDCL